MQTKARPSEQVTERELRNQALAFKIATEGVVLLSNNDALPISPCPIALYGSGAEYTIHGGSGSGEVNARHNVTVLEGLQEAGFTITTCDWIRRYDQLWRKGKRDFLSKVHWQMLVPRRHYFDRLMEMSYRYPSGDMLMDSELAEIAKLENIAPQHIGKIEGIGQKKVEKYGEALCQMYNQTKLPKD